jgi:purine-binding chemotaxis protein CheW
MNQIESAAAAGHQAVTQMQVVMLGIGDEVFALNTQLIREIIDPVPATRVAGARPYLPCVVNVRGNVIPLADLRARFGMPKTEDTADTRYVVLEIEIEGDPVLVAVVADKVHEVTQISSADVQQTPRVGMRWNPEFIRFITKWRDEFIIVPNMERILG